MRKQLLGKFRAEKDKMPAEKKTLVLTHFPRFLSLLEEEIYGESPIWDPEFRQAPPPHVQQMNDRLKTSSDTDSFRYLSYNKFYLIFPKNILSFHAANSKVYFVSFL